MVVLHTSDLHGDYKRPMQTNAFDVWVDTGDFFPNITRGHDIEPRWQYDWFTMTAMPLRKRYIGWIRNYYTSMGITPQGWYPSKSRLPRGRASVAKQLIEWLGGRPVISVPGNHDWQSLAKLLKKAGYKNAWDVSDGPVTLAGHRFAGFREVPWVTGEWMGEVGTFFEKGNFKPIVAKAMTAHPDVLVTHSPPYGILDESPLKDESGHAGIPELAQWLAYRPHDVKLHLFGHVHERGGSQANVMDITFVNSANTAQVVTL